MVVMNAVHKIEIDDQARNILTALPPSWTKDLDITETHVRADRDTLRFVSERLRKLTAGKLEILDPDDVLQGIDPLDCDELAEQLMEPIAQEVAWLIANGEWARIAPYYNSEIVEGLLRLDKPPRPLEGEFAYFLMNMRLEEDYALDLYNWLKRMYGEETVHEQRSHQTTSPQH